MFIVIGAFTLDAVFIFQQAALKRKDKSGNQIRLSY
jgi:hypothetical protein